MMMVKNSLVAGVEFYFKGERYTPSVRLDLNQLLETTGGVPSLYTLIARENGIDLYSYQFEVMQVEAIQFSEIEGFVADFIHNGELDLEGFVDKWRAEKRLDDLGVIARRYMGVEDLAEQPELLHALQEAYKLGQEQKA